MDAISPLATDACLQISKFVTFNLGALVPFPAVNIILHWCISSCFGVENPLI